MVYNQSINHQSIDGVTLPHLHPTSWPPPPLLSCPQRHEFIIHPWLSKFNATSPHSLCPPTGPCSYYSPISSPLSSLCIPISPTYVKLLYYIIVIIFYRNSKSQITLESISKGCSWVMVESKGEWVSEWPPLNNCHSAPIALIVVNRPVCSVVARRSSSVIRHRQTVCY